MDFKSDIPLTTAHAAHYGTSLVPERRAVQEQDGYAETLTRDYATLSELAARNGTASLLSDEFDRYRQGYRRRTMAYLYSRSRLVSTMIAGASKFPAARMNKRGDVAHKRLTELLEFRERAMAAIRRKLCPSAGPIMAGDADAVERLEREIRDAERLQNAMRETNKIIRKAPKYEPTPEKLAEIMTLGISHTRAVKLFERDCIGRIGFEDFALTNNSANIRRMKARLEHVKSLKSMPDTQTEGTAASIKDCPGENRVRLFFPGKPDSDTRGTLKSNGFRWTPSLGCWQAYRNSRSFEIARKIAGIAS